MKKKFFGIKFGAVLSVLLCLIFAVIFWFVVKYSQINDAEAFSAVGRIFTL